MSKYHIHDQNSAPEASRPLLAAVANKYGMIPNLMGIFAESPATLEAYLKLGEIFEQRSSFNAIEKQLILLAASFENECKYCMAAHSSIGRQVGMPDDVLQALREGTPIADVKLEALHSFVRKLVITRGNVSAAATSVFLAAGYTQAQVLECLLALAFKTLSNYTSHIAAPPVDAPFAKEAWTHPRE